MQPPPNLEPSRGAIARTPGVDEQHASAALCVFKYVSARCARSLAGVHRAVPAHCRRILLTELEE